MSGFIAVLGGVMFGLVAVIFLVEMLGYVAARLRHPQSTENDRRQPLPGAFNLQPTVSAVARRYQVNRLARWT